MIGSLIKITPTIDTVAYTANDQVGGIQTIAGVCQGGGSLCLLRQLTIVDRGKQKAAMTVFFFEELPTVASVNNGEANVTDAEMAGKAIAVVSIAAVDYRDLSGNSTATVAPNLAMKPLASATLYAVAVTTGTPSYVAATDLVFKYTFEW